MNNLLTVFVLLLLAVKSYWTNAYSGMYIRRDLRFIQIPKEIAKKHIPEMVMDEGIMYSRQLEFYNKTRNELEGFNISSACNYDKNVECIKQRTNCFEASQCKRAASYCQSRECYEKIGECQSTLSILDSCSSENLCPDSFSYTFVIEQGCLKAAASSVPRVTVFGGVSAVTVSLFYYFCKE